MPYLLGKNITKTSECIELGISKGFLYTGIFKTSYCFGSKTQPFSEGSSDSCTSQCQVEGEVCGSDSTANSVYSLPGISEYKDIGCYDMPETHISLGQVTTVDECLEKVKFENYDFAMIFGCTRGRAACERWQWYCFCI